VRVPHKLVLLVHVLREPGRPGLGRIEPAWPVPTAVELVPVRTTAVALAPVRPTAPRREPLAAGSLVAAAVIADEMLSFLPQTRPDSAFRLCQNPNAGIWPSGLEAVVDLARDDPCRALRPAQEAPPSGRDHGLGVRPNHRVLAPQPSGRDPVYRPSGHDHGLGVRPNHRVPAPQPSGRDPVYRPSGHDHSRVVHPSHHGLISRPSGHDLVFQPSGYD